MWKSFLEWLEDSNHVLYRGAPQEEKELQNRHFPGVFLTLDPRTAQGYGKSVSMWRLKRGKLLVNGTPAAKRQVNEFFEFFGLVSIGKAADLLGVHIDTLREWDAEGKLTP